VRSQVDRAEPEVVGIEKDKKTNVDGRQADGCGGYTTESEEGLLQAFSESN
jgi:hypothetical protein